MDLSIITPDETVYQGEVKALFCTGAEGTFSVLDNHAPMIVGLADGTLKYEEADGKITELMAESGVCEVLNNKVVVLVESVKAA